MSSLGVYGTSTMRSGSLLDEGSPIDPHPHLRDPYSYSKVMQEHAAREVSEEAGLPLVIVRPGVIIGPGRGVLSARVGLQLGPLMVRMGGTQTLPYTYVDNCAAAIRQAGLAAGVEGQVFNVIDDDLPTAKGLLRMCKRVGQKVKSVWVPRPLIQPMAGTYDWYHRWSRGQLPGVLTPYRTASIWKPLKYTNQKAKERLNWQPDVSFDEAFSSFAEWYRGGPLSQSVSHLSVRRPITPKPTAPPSLVYGRPSITDANHISYLINRRSTAKPSAWDGLFTLQFPLLNP